jgi:uncharacterized protein with HEPN domain
MARHTLQRLQDIAENINLIEQLVSRTTLPELQRDRISSAALERFLAIVSEASRHLPPDLTNRFQQVPWRRIADLGNVLRHAYQHIDPGILWDISRTQLPALKVVVTEMIQVLNKEAP